MHWMLVIVVYIHGTAAAAVSVPMMRGPDCEKEAALWRALAKPRELDVIARCIDQWPPKQ